MAFKPRFLLPGDVTWKYFQIKMAEGNPNWLQGCIFFSDVWFYSPLPFFSFDFLPHIWYSKNFAMIPWVHECWIWIMLMNIITTYSPSLYNWRNFKINKSTYFLPFPLFWFSPQGLRPFDFIPLGGGGGIMEEYTLLIDYCPKFHWI